MVFCRALFVCVCVCVCVFDRACLPQRSHSVDTSQSAIKAVHLSCSTHCLIGQCKTVAHLRNLVDKTDFRFVTNKCYKKLRPVP
jgi:hypothetical protein